MSASAGATAKARRHVSSTQFTIPAPAVGQGMYGEVILKVKAKNKKAKVVTPKLLVSNIAQLGQGYFAIQDVSAPKKTAIGKETVTLVYLEFMGSLSTNPASTATVTVTAPAGEAVAESEKSPTQSDGCSWLSDLNGRFEGTSTHTENLFGLTYVSTLSQFVPASADQSDPESFIDNVVSGVWGKCPGTPETPDEGGQ